MSKYLADRCVLKSLSKNLKDVKKNKVLFHVLMFMLIYLIYKSYNCNWRYKKKTVLEKNSLSAIVLLQLSFKVALLVYTVLQVVKLKFHFWRRVAKFLCRSIVCSKMQNRCLAYLSNFTILMHECINCLWTWILWRLHGWKILAVVLFELIFVK